MTTTGETTAFEKDTLYRMTVEAARYWAINHYLHKLRLPETASTFFVYPSGPEACLDWGNAPGPDAPDKPLRGKKIAVTFEIIDG